MKRFKVKNQKTGLEFVVERLTLEPLQPEWGKPQQTIRESVITVPAVLDAQGNVITPEVREDRERVLPAEFTVVEEDITAEIKSRADRDALIQATRTALIGLPDLSDSSTAAQVRAAARIMQQYLKALG